MNAVIKKFRPKKEANNAGKSVPVKDASKKSLEKHLKKVHSYESSQLQRILQSEKRAWRVATGAALIAVLSWIAIVIMLPLREIEAYVVRVNDTTGAVDVLTTSNEVFVSNNEALDNYWVSKFLHSYESYDWFTIQSDYDTVGALTTRTVGAEYEKKWEGSDAFHLKYKDTVRVYIEIESIIPTSENVRTVRFTRFTESLNRQNKVTEEKLVALIGYSYERTLKMTPTQRLANPIGFYVRSYRVDREIN